MSNWTKTSRWALIGGIAANAAMATLGILILSEIHILVSSIAAVCVALWILLMSVLWARRNKKAAPAEPPAEETGISRSRRRFLIRAGVFLIGVGETFLVGMLFFILLDYCSAHHHLARVLPFIGYYSPFFLFLVAAVFPAFNAWRRQWLLLAGNVLGPLLALGLVSLIALAIMAGPGRV